MFIAVRIRGRVKKPEIVDTLNKLMLRKRNNCMIYEERRDIKGMLEKSKDFIAYGEADEDTIRRIFEKRAEFLNSDLESFLKKMGYEDLNSLIKDMNEGKIRIKELRNQGLKLPFRLNSPRKGLKSVKLGFKQRGSLGYHGKEINDLVRRMI